MRSFREYRENRDYEILGNKLAVISFVIEESGSPFEKFWDERALPVILEGAYEDTDALLESLFVHALLEAGANQKFDLQGNPVGAFSGAAIGAPQAQLAGTGWNKAMDWLGGKMGYDPENSGALAKGAMGLAKAPGHVLNWLGNQGQGLANKFGNWASEKGGQLAANAKDQFNQQMAAQGGKPAFMNQLQHGNIFGPEQGEQGAAGQQQNGAGHQALNQFKQSAQSLTQAMGNSPQAASIKQQLDQIIQGAEQAMGAQAQAGQQQQQSGVPSSAPANQNTPANNAATSGSGLPSSDPSTKQGQQSPEDVLAGAHSGGDMNQYAQAAMQMTDKLQGSENEPPAATAQPGQPGQPAQASAKTAQPQTNQQTVQGPGVTDQQTAAAGPVDPKLAAQLGGSVDTSQPVDPKLAAQLGGSVDTTQANPEGMNPKTDLSQIQNNHLRQLAQKMYPDQDPDDVIAGLQKGGSGIPPTTGGGQVSPAGKTNVPETPKKKPQPDLNTPITQLAKNAPGGYMHRR